LLLHLSLLLLLLLHLRLLLLWGAAELAVLW
jgi:hypothetical protein